MLFCHFDEKNSKKSHSKLLKTFFCFNQGAVFFFIVSEKHLTSMVIRALGILE